MPKILLPVGRMIGGSNYEPQKQFNDDGTPQMDIKTGLQSERFNIGLAIPKKEQHWNQSEWGAKIYAIGVGAYPALVSTPSFSWKITDGDSHIPNKKGRRPCDQQGYPGHWVLWFSQSWAPVLVDREKQHIIQPGVIMPGDWIQVNAVVEANKPHAGRAHTPGVYLNPEVIVHIGYHREGRIITSSVNLNEIEVGAGGLPEGVLSAPAAYNPAQAVHNPAQAAYNSAPAAYNSAQAAHNPAPAAYNSAPAPNHEYYQTSEPVLTALAGTFTYQQYRASGWTDDTLRAAGYLV